MNICWPFFSIIKLYVQFAWQSQTSLCSAMCWPFRSAGGNAWISSSRAGLSGQSRDSWPGLQKVGFALADVELSLPSTTILHLKRPLLCSDNAGCLSGGDGRGKTNPKCCVCPKTLPWLAGRRVSGLELQRARTSGSCRELGSSALTPAPGVVPAGSFLHAENPRAPTRVSGAASLLLHPVLHRGLTILFFFFQDIDKFGNEITQLARPLPVEYLIIDVSSCCTHGAE